MSKLDSPQFTTGNNSDEKAETATPFLKKSWFDYLITLTFHRLSSNSKTSLDNIGAYLYEAPYGTILLFNLYYF